MAEFIFKKFAKDAGVGDRFEVASAAVSTEEIWNGVGAHIYPPAQRELHAHDIPFDEDKRATLLRKQDYDHYDLLIGMDDRNIRFMHKICGGDPEGKMHLMMEYAPHKGNRIPEVSDPWYSGDFSATWRDLSTACQGLLEDLMYDR